MPNGIKGLPFGVPAWYRNQVVFVRLGFSSESRPRIENLLGFFLQYPFLSRVSRVGFRYLTLGQRGKRGKGDNSVWDSKRQSAVS